MVKRLATALVIAITTPALSACNALLNNDSPKPLGLVLAYAFDEGEGKTTADASGNGNDGRIERAGWTSGKHGKALAFDLDARVRAPTSPSLELRSAFTIEAWVRPSKGGGWQVIVDKGVDEYWMVWSDPDVDAISAGMLMPEGCDDSPDVEHECIFRAEEGEGTLPIGMWSHIGATFDGSVIKLFKDGREVFSQSKPGTLERGTGDLQIGNTDASDACFGAIDDVRIYERAISDDELRDDMNTPVD